MIVTSTSLNKFNLWSQCLLVFLPWFASVSVVSHLNVTKHPQKYLTRRWQQTLVLHLFSSVWIWLQHSALWTTTFFCIFMSHHQSVNLISCSMFSQLNLFKMSWFFSPLLPRANFFLDQASNLKWACLLDKCKMSPFKHLLCSIVNKILARVIWKYSFKF